MILAKTPLHREDIISLVDIEPIALTKPDRWLRWDETAKAVWAARG
jgi:hypothetical protein